MFSDTVIPHPKRKCNILFLVKRRLPQKNNKVETAYPQLCLMFFNSVCFQNNFDNSLVTGSYSGISAPVTFSVACDGIDFATKRSSHNSGFAVDPVSRHTRVRPLPPKFFYDYFFTDIGQGMCPGSVQNGGHRGLYPISNKDWPRSTLYEYDQCISTDRPL